MSIETLLCLGGNIGNRVALIESAIDQIGRDIGEVIATSSIYETEPWGFKAEQNFYNVVVAVETSLEPIALLDSIQAIETLLGRDRREGTIGYSSRTMDIDIISYGAEVISSKRLTTPHPHLHNRAFVLYPLAEIRPNWIHPILKESAATILRRVAEHEDSKPKKI